MIFVTFGSTRKTLDMDFIIPVLDKAAAQMQEHQFMCQAGEAVCSTSIMQIFDYTDDFSAYIDKSDLIITADGAGTIFECLKKNKKTLVIANPNGIGAPASDFVAYLHRCNHLSWYDYDKDPVIQIRHALDATFDPLEFPPCSIAADIVRYLKED